jgi:hypothetical protein
MIGGDDGSSFMNATSGNTSSMVGGAAQDYFYLKNILTSDTIDGGGGGLDSVTFLYRASTDVLNVTAGATAGSYDVNFGYREYNRYIPSPPIEHITQTTHVSNVEYLIFNDGNYIQL